MLNATVGVGIDVLNDAVISPGYDYGTNGFLEFGAGAKGSLPFRIDQSGNVTALSVNAHGTVNVLAYGADPTGAASSTTAFQNAIAACIPSTNPATTTRGATSALIIPPGTYKITSDLVIRSVQGFTIIGAGPSLTTLVASGTGFTQAVLFIDGSADGMFSGFAVQGDGTEMAGANHLPDGIRLDYTTAAFRSTTGNRFSDIRVRSLNFVTGFGLEGTGARQLDGTLLTNVIVSGGQVAGTWNNATLWQNAFAAGNGTFGNNYNHWGIDISPTGCINGFNINVSSLGIKGSEPAGNQVTFLIVPGAAMKISDVQDQSCGQFISNPSGFSPLPVAFECCEIKSANLNGSDILAAFAGGQWIIDGLSATITSGASYVSPVINIAGAGAGRPCAMSLRNVQLYGTRTSAIVPTANEANITVENYVNYNASAGTVTTAPGDLSSVYTSGQWINTDQAPKAAVLAPSFGNGTAAQLSDTSRDYEVYFQIGTGGTAFTLSIGPTSTPANTLISSATVVAGQQVRFRLPAGWYAEWSATTATLALQAAVGC
jgi:hypothetical protein